MIFFLGKTCSFVNPVSKCSECNSADLKVMDYSQSPYKKSGDPKYNEVHCEPKTTTIDGSFSVDDQLSFQQCLTNCKKCSDTQTCEECLDPTGGTPLYPYQVPSPHQCVTCLPESKRFVDQADSKCKDCPAECTKCTSLTQCTECISNLYILNLNSGPCVSCPTSGFQIQGEKCLRICQPHEYRTSNNECVRCPTHCASCSDVTGECSSCERGFALDQVDKLCWKGCGFSQFNINQNTCQGCPLHCSACSRINGKCTLCQEGYEFDKKEDKCLKRCEKSEFRKNQSTCQKCAEYCSNCQDITGECLKCEEGYNLDPTQKKCTLSSKPLKLVRGVFNNILINLNAI